MQFEKDKEGKDGKTMARIIFESALLESGYTLENPKAFNQRIYELLARSLNIKKDISKGAEFDKSLDQVREQRLGCRALCSAAFAAPPAISQL